MGNVKVNIGDIVEFRGNKYECVPCGATHQCLSCAFVSMPTGIGACGAYNCHPLERKDKRHVYFVKIRVSGYPKADEEFQPKPKTEETEEEKQRFNEICDAYRAMYRGAKDKKDLINRINAFRSGMIV